MITSWKEGLPHVRSAYGKITWRQARKQRNETEKKEAELRTKTIPRPYTDTTWQHNHNQLLVYKSSTGWPYCSSENTENTLHFFTWFQAELDQIKASLMQVVPRLDWKTWLQFASLAPRLPAFASTTGNLTNFGSAWTLLRLQRATFRHKLAQMKTSMQVWPPGKVVSSDWSHKSILLLGHCQKKMYRIKDDSGKRSWETFGSGQLDWQESHLFQCVYLSILNSFQKYFGQDWKDLKYA